MDTEQGKLENWSGPRSSKISMNRLMLRKGNFHHHNYNVDDDDADYALGEEVS